MYLEDKICVEPYIDVNKTFKVRRCFLFGVAVALTGLLVYINPLSAYSHKMAKHTQTIRRLLLTNRLDVFGHFLGLPLKGVINLWIASLLLKRFRISEYLLWPWHCCILSFCTIQHYMRKHEKLYADPRGEFTTLPIIYDGAFFPKIVNGISRYLFLP